MHILILQMLISYMRLMPNRLDTYAVTCHRQTSDAVLRNIQAQSVTIGPKDWQTVFNLVQIIPSSSDDLSRPGRRKPFKPFSLPPKIIKTLYLASSIDFSSSQSILELLSLLKDSLFHLEFNIQWHMTGLNVFEYILPLYFTFYFIVICSVLVFVDKLWSVYRPYVFH